MAWSVDGILKPKKKLVARRTVDRRKTLNSNMFAIFNELELSKQWIRTYQEENDF